jgi:hypothetical protein
MPTENKHLMWTVFAILAVGVVLVIAGRAIIVRLRRFIIHLWPH